MYIFVTYLLNMKLLFVLTDKQYQWLKTHAHDIGESMSTIIRRALREYKSKL
jgi:negative regulator of replication initiation